MTPATRLRAALCAVPLLLLPACGNDVSAEVVGMTAVTVDGQGRPVILVSVCTGGVDTVEIVGGREGLGADEPNPEVATWTAPSPQDGTSELAVSAPASPWSGTADVTLAAGRLYVVNARRSDQDAETTQVSLRGSDLAQLDPTRVIVRDGDVWTRARFDADAC